MKRLTAEERAALEAAARTDPRVDRLLSAYDHCETLLRRSLFEFGSEIRTEIERFLGEAPLLPPGR